MFSNPPQIKMQNIKNELLLFIKSQTPSNSATLSKASNSLHIDDLPHINADRIPCLKTPDEDLFFMFHLFSKGQNYKKTFLLCDVFYFSDLQVVKMYKTSLYSFSQVMKRVIITTGDFNTVPFYSSYVYEPENIISKLYFFVYKMLICDVFEEQKMKIIFKLMGDAKEEYKMNNKIPKGVTIQNIVHDNYFSEIINEIKLEGIYEILVEMESILLFVNELLIADKKYEFCIENAEKIIRLPVLYRAYLSNILFQKYYCCFFFDFERFKVFIEQNDFDEEKKFFRALVFYRKYLNTLKMISKEEDNAFAMFLYGFSRTYGFVFEEDFYYEAGDVDGYLFLKPFCVKYSNIFANVNY